MTPGLRRSVRMAGTAALVRLGSTLALSMGLCMPSPGAAAQLVPALPIISSVDRTTFWVDSTICSVVLKASIDATKPLVPGTPIDQLSSLGAICTSNITGQNLVVGGVRSLLAEGFRVTSMSHHVAVLTPATADGRSEVLISVLFGLERPQQALAR